MRVLFIYIAAPHSMWDLDSPNRVWTCTICIGRWRLNHWTAWEVPFFLFLNHLKSLVRKRAHFLSACPKLEHRWISSSQFTAEHKTRLLTISIVSDPYQSFILFPNCSSKGELLCGVPRTSRAPLSPRTTIRHPSAPGCKAHFDLPGTRIIKAGQSRPLSHKGYLCN